ncbi:MAG: hydrolase 1, exosortase A system-associated [Denitromonas halophila]|uniref:Hydrolase 1, exosortase A system-associated n=2 Tax=Denitromonas TaxID=139331 RepID=A0A557RCI6_9RHOO|nr:hydrolase 1, exosortase A system-associated [Denitromonas ohlonensis]TVO75008.1 hydrolase 1, exosortase A system-associated [Denitromonas ohlonensis]TVT75999.1 MAG: hydrolase 1, exosortase A system-associated [Denitromonas halophila]
MVLSEEIPIAFDCQGEQLVGIVHRPEAPRRQGVLAIVAGGPQYRGGCCRQLLVMARTFATDGTPVMRFDYRGMGDSEGVFKGFESTHADLLAAIEIFKHQVPELEEVILWGGCDAASASLINAWRLPEVSGLILGNPWVHSEQTEARVAIKHHYSKRIYEWSFWRKVLTLQYNPLPVAGGMLKSLLRKRAPAPASAGATDFDARPFQEKMREGLSHFKGRILLLMSGRSLLSKEFDELVASDTRWQTALKAPADVARHDVAEADQAFSTIAARDEIIATARQWLAQWPTH